MSAYKQRKLCEGPSRTGNNNEFRGSLQTTMNIPELTSTSISHSARTAAALLCLALSCAATAQSGSPLATLIFEPARPGTAPAAPAAEDAAATGNALQQDSGAADSVEEYLAAISRSVEDKGLYSQALSEQYEALGVLYYQQGEYDNAIDAFEDAMHIQKVNKGLFNLDQTRLVEYLIRTHIARGDFIAVDNHKHYLYYLQDKNLAKDDPRLVAAKLDWADWNVEAYVKGYRESFSYPVALSDSLDAARGIRNTVSFNVEVERPVIDNSGISSPGVNQGETVTETIPVMINVPLLNANSVITSAAITDYNLRSVPLALSNDIIVNQRLYEAENIYESLLDQVDDAEDASLQERTDLQLKLANINYLLKKELDRYEQITDQGSIAFNRVNQEYTSDAAMITSRRYVQIKNDFEALTGDIVNSPSTSPLEKARAYIALGDLHLSFDRPQRAFDAYETAIGQLTADGYSLAEAQAILSPEPTLAVPGFGMHRFSRGFFDISPDTDIPWRGHIDVRFDKDRYGSVSGVKVVAASDDTPQQVRSALVDYLRNQRFRPAFADGQATEQRDIALRYFYYY